MGIAIWWIRRDLRLADNQALTAARRHGEQIIPLFILDPGLLDSRYASARRTAFLMAGLRELDASLRRRGGRLIVRQGDPAQVLPEVLAEANATSIFAEEDYSPYARKRDRALQQMGLPLRLTPGLTVHPPDLIKKSDGTPYTVFTPFSRVWRSMPQPSTTEMLLAPTRLSVPEDLAGVSIPFDAAIDLSLFPAGETEAIRRLDAFLEGTPPRIADYDEQRNRPDLEGTSQLSPYLRFGMLSPRAVVAAVAEMPSDEGNDRKGAEVWLNELIWREFFISILAHFPHVRRGSFRPHFDEIQWENNAALFTAWRRGETGYPLVDAAMRQLRQTGWMHNRSRMVTASFLVKHLLIDWRWGEQYFMQQLIDGDPAANNGGWQWVAGTGTDAAPYFRVFNPILQGKKFDPEGQYIRRWVPELASVPLKYLHEPWRMPASVQRQFGVRVGHDYPAPVVDHAAARERALAAYQRVKV